MSTNSIRVLSLIPPMTQLNTPYPSTAYLTGFLRSRGVDAVQEDLALALVLKLFSTDGLLAIRDRAEAIPKRKRSPIVNAFHQKFDRYLSTITPAIAFLQGRDPTLAHRICGRQFLPEGPRFKPIDFYLARRQRRSAGLGVRRAWDRKTAPNTWRRSTSTISPTCCATPSTRALSSSAMPNLWRKANRPSIRSPKRWPRRSIWSTAHCAI